MDILIERMVVIHDLMEKSQEIDESILLPQVLALEPSLSGTIMKLPPDQPLDPFPQRQCFRINFIHRMLAEKIDDLAKFGHRRLLKVAILVEDQIAAWTLEEISRVAARILRQAASECTSSEASRGLPQESQIQEAH